VTTGERVALLLRDGPDFISAFLGAAKIGAVAVPVSTFARPAELAFLLGDSGAAVAIVEGDLVDTVLATGIGLRALVTTGVARQEAIALEGLLRDVRLPLAAAETRGDDMCFWQYSSGTTGSPKAVIHLHERARFPAVAHARHVVRLREDDRVYSTAKLFFSYGLNNSLVIPLAVGASAVLDPERFDPERAWSLIARERPTVLYSVPTAYAALLAAAEAGEGGDVSSLRLCVSAGEALPGPLLERWSRRFGLPILDGIGSTEIGYIAISNTEDDIVPGSSGRPIPGYAAKVADPSGRELPEGEDGALWVRGGSTAAGYHGAPERSAAAFREGWIVTGDRYRVTDGHFFYLGRDDDMLKVAGQWVSPLEVESALAAHPDVLESAVVGRADADGLLKPAAFVVPKDRDRSAAALAAELERCAAERLARHKRPRWIEVIDALPKTPTGKVQRYLLRERAARSDR